MKNTFGNSLTVTLFGESHGPAVGAVLDGITPGLPVDTDVIACQLRKRRPSSVLDTERREPDRFEIMSGVFEGKTTGTPLCILIQNEDVRSGDYVRGSARPSHADYTAYVKYHGYEDYRGSGHFSGRVTAALTAVGGILLPALSAHGISVGTHILQCGAASDRPFDDTEKDVHFLSEAPFPVLDPAVEERISEEILRAKNDADSIGGKTQTAVTGLPAGLGEPWFDSVEGQLSHILFSIGGIKGVEFGDGFGFCGSRASEKNDALRVRNGKIVTETNHNGGINGGITNGMPLIFQCAVKPTPSIAQPQNTVDMLSGEETVLTTAGRHDPAIVRRICPVIDAVTSIVICDLLVTRYGTDALAGGAF